MISKLRRWLARIRAFKLATVNLDFPGARVPCFVDAEGRRCAVAHLLHRFGEDSLVAEVAATDNHACVSDLANHPAPATAITSVGLMLDRHPGLEFSALSRGTNYAVAPPWLYPVLLSTL